MITTPLTEDPLKWAMARIEDFYTVQKGSEWADKVMALGVLRESLGINDDLLGVVSTWCDGFIGSEDFAAPVLLGLMVGLIAADRQREAP